MRNITKTITAISLLAPVSAFPLGIGDIKLHSALNQNLDAEIKFLVSKGEKVSDLRVKLASPEKFDEAGVPWNYFLSKIEFETVTAPNGSTIIKVSSKEALKEPFLDFLVEVSWDKGSLYREFTVLVDPPVSYTQSVTPVIQQAEQVQVEEHRPEAFKPRVDQSRGINSVSDGTYGPTERNDSLWKVAERTNAYDDVTREQMMVAIFEANPKAFYKPNVNALKAGKTLNIPEKEVILRLSKKEAQQAFKEQVDAWEGLADNKSKDKTLAQSSGGDSDVNAQLDLKSPAEEEIPEAAMVVSDKDASTKSDDKQKSEPSAITLSDDNFALQAKMEKLEQQLAMMQKMLVLKDEQIASLLNQKKLADASETDKGSVATPETEDALKDTKAEDQPVAESDIKPTTEAEKEKEKEKEKEEPVIDPVSESEDGSISTAMMSAIALPILGLLGWALWRRNREDDEVDTESIFASAKEIIPSDPLDEENIDSSIDKLSSIGEETDHSAFLSEFENSDFHTFDKDSNEDVDPVLEADVYLAYGRYQQAEELMRQAIIDQPERDECKLKLLEIFHTHEDKNAFDEYVTELEKSGKNKDQKFWSKVVEMADDLDVKSVAASALHDESAAEKASFSIDDSSDGLSASDTIHPTSNDIAKKPKEAESEPLDSEVKDDNGVEFDLSIFDEDDNEKEAELGVGLDVATDENDFDFDLSDFDLDESDTVSVNDKKTSDKTGEDDIETFDFDFDTAGEKTADEDVADLTDMDEIETKIDLAKAYIDMGDYEAAKVIAKEALERGNSEQKVTAKGILDLLE